jgi:CheY-like chemotaxis protein
MPSEPSTILLVEDQQALLRLYQRDLEANGYTVLTATDATDALAKCRAYVGPIHLLIADIFLPMALRSGTTSNQPVTVNGIELSQAVKTLRPHIQVLFISGMPENDIEALGGLPPGKPFLPKPFSTEALLKTVGDLVKGLRPQ